MVYIPSGGNENEQREQGQVTGQEEFPETLPRQELAPEKKENRQGNNDHWAQAEKGQKIAQAEEEKQRGDQQQQLL